MENYLDRVKQALADLELDDITPLLTEALDAGEKATLLGAMSAGMVVVGERFEAGEYFLADLVLAGEEMKKGVEVLGPTCPRETPGLKGRRSSAPSRAISTTSARTWWAPCSQAPGSAWWTWEWTCPRRRWLTR